ncbi:hypothetical protein JO972_05720 [Verrucomicrobiaceae bacterium 5K15]|uniref:Uncharacterized protein n=1 Tax=Oceaniferula flava TaxID=2800421 RepID=A0AAE2VBE2_9BACT|nr:hypothetical protein [Oceaniferula flavus]MBK1854445.1 hypothetical protein [Oceaniferula flavus]MBM1135751.1 hypothetical protein [Oceaniferula flavus]
MSSYYKNPVAVFGLMLPLLGFAVLAAGAFYGSSTINKKFKKKKRVYDRAQVAERAMLQLQAKVGQNGPALKRWEELMSTETRSTFVDHWKEAEGKLKGTEFTRAQHNWINYSEGLGKGVAQPASQVEMNFAATYRAMQIALLEIESELPQLQLDSLTMSPGATGGKLNFKTTFTVWTQK